MAPLPAPFAPKGTAMAEVAPATLVYAEASSSLPVTDHTTTPSLETGSLIEDIANTIAPEIANALEASLESFDEVSSISSEPTDITSDAVFQTWVPTELASLDIPVSLLGFHEDLEVFKNSFYRVKDVAGSSEAPTQAVAVSKPIESSHVTPPAPTRMFIVY